MVYGHPRHPTLRESFQWVHGHPHEWIGDHPQFFLCIIQLLATAPRRFHHRKMKWKSLEDINPMNLEGEHGYGSKPKQTTTVSFRDIREIPRGFMDSNHPKMWVEMGQAFPYQLHPSAPSIHHFSLAQKKILLLQMPPPSHQQPISILEVPMHPLIHSEPPPQQNRETWKKTNANAIPICSMYGIFTTIYTINGPNVGNYTIHGAYGIAHNWGSRVESHHVPTCHGTARRPLCRASAATPLNFLRNILGHVCWEEWISSYAANKLSMAISGT